jgi:CheY-like chemotaxis protein
MIHSLDKILVVDDDPLNVDIVIETLGDTYTYKVAGSGEEALEISEAFQPNIIILDIMMPGIDGYETCRRLRQKSHLRKTKIIMVTAKAMINERVSGYHSGADDYITKPFEDIELIRKVDILFDISFMEELNQIKQSYMFLLANDESVNFSKVLNNPSHTESILALDYFELEHLEKLITSGYKLLHYLEKTVSRRNQERILR